MARPRKPLKMQVGHLTVVTQNEKKQEEEMITIGQEQLARSPTWLIDAVAKKEYKRITKEFKSVGIIGNLDVNNIAAYCNAYSFYLKATDQLRTQPLVLTRQGSNGNEMLIENPLIKIQKGYADEMRKFAALCGLTIDSRLKIATVKTTKQEQEMEEEFGGI